MSSAEVRLSWIIYSHGGARAGGHTCSCDCVVSEAHAAAMRGKEGIEAKRGEEGKGREERRGGRKGEKGGWLDGSCKRMD